MFRFLTFSSTTKLYRGRILIGEEEKKKITIIIIIVIGIMIVILTRFYIKLIMSIIVVTGKI